ncbi:glycosyltransferase family 8 protein [Myriangium duriaei CBS 260.36]|uniref:Glycosyltransferase family 8 protein n=1 Tax=Myriangium duriaei CBS 260.36 TaxID=1168546 RepID=A0A9P4JD85_9PEZI|nr:glycosyltransferase family 8 protein [Myriangium duriaei CBS 260.36]
MSTASLRTIGLCLTLFLSSALLTWTVRHHSSSAGSLPIPHKPHARPRPPSHRLAYATFLAGNPHSDPNTPDNEDGYFLGARVLTYQLLHSPVVSTNLSIPFLILVTPDVSASKCARLTADGATVIPIDKLNAAWVKPGQERWRDVLAKLRLWQLSDYSRVCFLDSDTLVTRRMDQVFFDEAVTTRSTLPNPERLNAADAPLPRSYVFASHVDYWKYDHAFPPEDGSGYFNVGFFVYSPSQQMYDYYVSLLSREGSFDPQFPEQNLLNYAHRREGNMPWSTLWHGWNVNWPIEKDWRNGVASFHAKYWDGDATHSAKLKAIWREQRAEMEGYWRGKEGRTERVAGVLGE